MIYEIVTLAGSVFTAKKVKSGARQWLAEARYGTSLAMWTTDIGHIGDLTILREFDDETSLAAERHRALMSEDPFGCTSAGVRLRMESYMLFPFLPAPPPRDYGGIFEIRTYHLVSNGLTGTLDGWQAAITPAHEYTDHLVVGMYAADGDPRITHIWGFESVEQRNRLRHDHYSAGLWPPKGGPERIDHATSTIAIAEPHMPIC